MNLAEWMSWKKLDDAEVAAMVGLSRSQICRIRLRRSIPSPATAKRIAEKTGLSAEGLMFVERERAA